MDLPPDIMKHAAGPLGAAGAMLLMKGKPWMLRLTMVLPMLPVAHYGAPFVGDHVGLSEGLAGCMIGLLGPAAIAKLLETWEALDLGSILKKLIYKWLGLKDEEEGQQP
jgi:hypothetical protein